MRCAACHVAYRFQVRSLDSETGSGATRVQTRQSGAADRVPAAVLRMWPALASGALMLALGVWGLGRPSMYSGESATRWAATLSVSQLHKLVGQVDAVHALYYSFMHVWLLPGDGVVMMRVPSLVGMVAAVMLTAVLGVRLTGSRRVGFVAGVVLALVPFIDDYAQNARSYAMVVAFVLAGGLALLRALERPTWPRWAVYGLLVALAGWLHEMSLLAVAAHAVTLLIAGTPLRTARRWLVSAAVGCALVLPLVYVSHKEARAVSWIRPTRLSDVKTLFHVVFGTSTTVSVLAAACAIVGALGMRRRPTPPSSTTAGPRLSLPAFAAPLLVIPPALLLIESAVGTPLYDPRYVLYCVPGAALLTAAGLDRIGTLLAEHVGHRSARAVTATPAAVLCLLAVALQWHTQSWLRTDDSRPQNYLAAATYVAHRARPGDGVLYIPTSNRMIALGYPAQFATLDDFSVRKSPRASGRFHGLSKSAAGIRAGALRQKRIWVLQQAPKSYTGRAKAEHLLLVRYFRLVRSKHFHGISAALWERRTTLAP